MSVIGSLENAWNYVTGDKKPAPATAPASAPAPVAQTTTPVAGLAGQTNSPSGAAASSNVTNTQGHTARLALSGTGGGLAGGPPRTDDIPPPPPARLEDRVKYDKTAKTDANTNLNDESYNSRLRGLDNVSQLDDNKKTTNDEQRCGASSIVAGAYYAGGKDGIKKLIADQEAYCKSHNLKNKDPYFGDKELKKRVESGEITTGDLNKIQENLHKSMRERQGQTPGNDNNKIVGVRPEGLKEFMNEATNTKKAFDERGLTLVGVDTDRQNGANHCVLAGQHAGKSFVYDPMSISSDGVNLDQVITDPEKLQVYRDSLEAHDGQKYVYSGANVPAR